MDKFISVGKILNFHGIKGEAKVGYSKIRQDFFMGLDSVYVKSGPEYKELIIDSCRPNKSFLLVKFNGIDSIDQILEYKGLLLFVKEDTIRENLDEDEFLIDELVGLDVYDGEKKVGAVVGVSNNGASDLLSVRTKGDNVSLVPFVKAIVLSVDIKSRRIQINNIEGLLS